MARLIPEAGSLWRLLAVPALLATSLAPTRTADAACTTLFSLGGNTRSYVDCVGTKQLSGPTEFSNRGRGFGTRAELTVPPGFQYGVYGMDETDADGDANYTDRGDVDPLTLMTAMNRDGYNIALSSNLGGIQNKAKIVRTLRGAKERNLKLIVRALKWKTGFALDRERTNTNLQRFNEVLAEPGNEDLNDVIYAWYSYDEPLNKEVSLSDLKAAYALHKADNLPYIKNKPVFTVFNQNQNCADGPDGDRLGECLLGESRNQYAPNTADIVGLNVYPAVPRYGYLAIGNLYKHARRVVGPNKPVFAVAQAHALTGDVANSPEPHQLYRQVNDWFRAGAEIRQPIQGYLWYSWHFPDSSRQKNSDLEGNRPNRAMASAIGASLRSGRLVTHKTPYKSELFRPAGASKVVTAPRAGHMNSPAGTINFGLTHMFVGNDGQRHVLFDTGGKRNRLFIEKGADNVLRLVIVDGGGKSKSTGIRVDKRNFNGEKAHPGYSQITATWNNGAIALYLDGRKGGVRAGSGTGKLSSLGRTITIGTDAGGRYGANGTYSSLNIRSNPFTATEASAYSRDSLLK